MAADNHGITEHRGNLRIRVRAGRDPQTGQQRRLYATVAGTSQAAWERARRQRRVLERQAQETLDTEREAPPDAHTVGEVLDRWLAQVSGGLSANTQRKYRYNAEHYLAALRPLGLASLTPHAVEDHYAALAASGTVGGGLSPQTIATAHRTLHRALEYAVRWGWLAANPVTVAEPPTLRRIDRELPAPDALGAVMALFNFDEDPEFALWLRIAAVTGARRGEIAALRWSDCDFTAGEVLIRRAVVIGEDAQGREKISVRPSTKTDKPRRIALGARTTKLLIEHRKRCEAAAALCEVALDDGYVFAVEPDGRDPWHPHRVTTRFMRARKRLTDRGVDLTGVRLGDLRHYVASQMLKAGESVTDTAARLGNSPRTVLANYAHHIPAEDHGAAAMLDSLLR